MMPVKMIWPKTWWSSARQLLVSSSIPGIMRFAVGLQWGRVSGYDIESADTVSLLMEHLSHTQIKHLGSIMSISVDT
jgi:hypothetical protein